MNKRINLTPLQKEQIVLSGFYGLSYQQISKVVNVPRSTLKTWLDINNVRCRKDLAKEFWKARAKGDLKIAEALYNLAIEDGNTKALLHLAECRLKQNSNPDDFNPRPKPDLAKPFAEFVTKLK